MRLLFTKLSLASFGILIYILLFFGIIVYVENDIIKSLVVAIIGFVKVVTTFFKVIGFFILSLKFSIDFAHILLLLSNYCISNLDVSLNDDGITTLDIKKFKFVFWTYDIFP